MPQPQCSHFKPIKQPTLSPQHNKTLSNKPIQAVKRSNASKGQPQTQIRAVIKAEQKINYN